MLGTDHNKELVRRFIETFWNERNLDLADECIASDCQSHQLRSGARVTAVLRGPAAMKIHIAEWLQAFPDLKFAIEQIFSEGDKIFTQLVMEGTQTGSWYGIPPSGKQVPIRMMTVHRIEGGKIAEDWVLVESMGFFQQLGLIAPTPVLLSRASTNAGAPA